MTNREWLNSLPDEEFAKFLDINDLRFIIPGFGPPHICDYKHEGQKRCKEMNECHNCIDNGWMQPPECKIDGCFLTRPPQSWQFVEELE